MNAPDPLLALSRYTVLDLTRAREILEEFGYNAAAIEDLKQRGIV